MNLQEEVQTKIAVQAPLKLSSQNSGDDRGIWVCDGVDAFYSGDGHSYYRKSFRLQFSAEQVLQRVLQIGG